MFHKSTGVIYPTNNMTEPLTESLPEFLDIANEIYENNWCQSIVNFTISSKRISLYPYFQKYIADNNSLDGLFSRFIAIVKRMARKGKKSGRDFWCFRRISGLMAPGLGM